jgi:hypothetical protein
VFTDARPLCDPENLGEWTFAQCFYMKSFWKLHLLSHTSFFPFPILISRLATFRFNIYLITPFSGLLGVLTGSSTSPADLSQRILRRQAVSLGPPSPASARLIETTVCLGIMLLHHGQLPSQRVVMDQQVHPLHSHKSTPRAHHKRAHVVAPSSRGRLWQVT